MGELMRILILSFYFSPDLSAGSFRNTALVNALKEKVPAGCQIDVVTTLPSRYASFTVHAPEVEINSGVNVYRANLPVHKSGMLDQSRSFLHYAYVVRKLTAFKEYDLVYASSSRLMTAVLGAYISRRKKAPLYLDIRDIFVDTIKDVLPKKLVWLLKPTFSLIEKWAFSRATKINLVSGGFKSYFESRYQDKPLSYFTNGIDQEFIDTASKNNHDMPTKSLPEVLYAGNLGEGQGLHSIIPDLAARYEGQLYFKVLGDGGRKTQLESALKAKGVTNVKLLSPVSREELINAYQKADVLFLHLNGYDAFLKVLPSKVFEYAALGKPIWAGVSGFAAEFIQSEISNAAVFYPCDVDGAVNSFNTLDLHSKSRPEFINSFSRDKIMKKMAEDILSVVELDRL